MNSGSRWLVRALVVMILLVGTLTAAALGQGRPAHISIIGPPAPVGSLRELWTKTPVVVLATALEVGPSELHNKTVVKFQFFDVDEVLKDEDGVLKNHRIRVIHEGGTGTFAGEVYETRGSDGPPPKGGQQVVLFLSRGKSGFFAVPFGPGGTYPVTDKVTDAITLSLTAQKFPEFSGRREINKNDFLTLLHDLAAGR